MTRKFPKGIKVVWKSCPFCKNELAGTDNYGEIKSFTTYKELDKHMIICEYNKEVMTE